MEDCIFCKISRREVPADIVYDGREVIAFPDISPKAPVHMIIIPKKHIDPQKPFTDQDMEFCKEIMEAAKKIAAHVGIESTGFRLLVNIGSDAGQEVDHMHFHLMGGRKLGDLG